MKIILLQDIPTVGRKSEIKEVREGYARNFLLPRKLAVAATGEAVKRLERESAIKEAHLQTLERTYREISEKLKNITLTFKMKVGERGKAFGSISEEDIKTGLKEEGIKIEKNWLDLEAHIKTTGPHRVPIKFPHDIKGEIRVIVEAE